MRNPDAVKAIRSPDLIIAAGCTVFDDFFYQAEDIIPKSAKLVHIDSDPGSVGKSEPTDIAILAAPSEVVSQLAEAVSYEFAGTKAEEAALRVKDAAVVTTARMEAIAE